MKKGLIPTKNLLPEAHFVAIAARTHFRKSKQAMTSLQAGVTRWDLRDTVKWCEGALSYTPSIHPTLLKNPFTRHEKKNLSRRARKHFLLFSYTLLCLHEWKRGEYADWEERQNHVFQGGGGIDGRGNIMAYSKLDSNLMEMPRPI